MFQQGRRPYPPMLSNQQMPIGDELLGYPPQPAGYYVADDPQEFFYTPEGDVIVMPPIMAYEEDNGQYMPAGMQSPYDPNYLPQDDVVFVPVDAPDFMPRDMPPPSNYRPLPPPQQQQFANYRPQQQQQQQSELTQYVPAAPQQQTRTSNYDEEPLTLVIQKKKQKKKKSRKCRHDDDSDDDSDDDDECDCNCRRVSRPSVNYAFIPVMIPQPATPQPVAAPAPTPAPAPAPVPAPVQPVGITWFASGIRSGASSQYEEQQRDAIVAERLGYQIQRNCCM